MLKVSIFERIKDNHSLRQMLVRPEKRVEKKVKYAIPYHSSKSSKEKPKVTTVQATPAPGSKCFFWSGKIKISCSKDGKFNSKGNPVNKCEDFPCIRYDELMFLCKKRKEDHFNELRLDGVTAEEWADEFFRCGSCSSCGKDRTNHNILPLEGHWFAICKEED